MIRAENLTKKFQDITAVDSINVSIDKGDVFGFLGPNGAGKTTVINMMNNRNFNGIFSVVYALPEERYHIKSIN